MQHASTRVLFCFLALLTGAGPVLPIQASPLTGVHGIGAAAILDPPSTWSVNPALLATSEVNELWSGMLAQSEVDLLQAQWTIPTLHGPNWGLGLQQQRSSLAGSETWVQGVQFGLGHTLRRGWRTGVNLQLWNISDVRDFAATAGVLYGTPTDQRAQEYQLAIVVNNLVEPLANPFGTDSKRSVDVAASLGRPLSKVWTVSSSVGLRTGRDLRRQASVAAVLRWKQRLDFGAGLQSGQLRLTAGVRSRAGSLHWTLHDIPEGGAHELGIRWSWGASLPQRSVALELEQASLTQTHINSAVARFEATRLTQWKSFAQNAFERGDLDRAASFFSMVLAGYPEDREAQAGFTNSRHAMFVAEADSLIKHRKYGSAAHALEEALQLSPSDSTSAVRLRQVRQAARFAFRQQSDTEQLFREGIDSFAQQNYIEAMSAFRGVLALDPEHNMATSYLSQTEQAHRTHVESTLAAAKQRLDSKEFEAARKQVHRLLADEPDQPQALQTLAAINKAERREQSRQRALQAEARRLAKAQEAAAAQADLHAAQEDAAPTPPSEAVIATYKDGIRLYRTGNLVAAMQAWEEVARQTPHYEGVDGYLLRVYRVTGLEKYTEGRLQEAVEIWGKALQLDPTNHQLRRYLNQAQVKLKRANERMGSEE